MLELHIEKTRLFDEATSTFSYVGPTTVKLEHSLVSMSKWESKHQIPFLSSAKTPAQVNDYVHCMSLSGPLSAEVVLALTNKHQQTIAEYISSPMSATTFSDIDKRPAGRSEIITSELIYYWMVSASIPMECERWHLNRLITLIRICSIKNNTQKKIPQRDQALRAAAINRQRRAKARSKG